jgi:hypothetical protein
MHQCTMAAAPVSVPARPTFLRALLTVLRGSDPKKEEPNWSTTRNASSYLFLLVGGAHQRNMAS